jgi:monoamine oxidase
MPLLDKSLVDILREELGGWWEMPMYTPRDGMETIPNAFVNTPWDHRVKDKLLNHILFGFKVTSIKQPTDGSKGLNIIGIDRCGRVCEFEGFDAVICTTTLSVVRTLDIDIQPDFPYLLQDAIHNISYVPSTKVLVQFNKKFWEKSGLFGGFSKSDALIGQLHYPENAIWKIRDENGVFQEIKNPSEVKHWKRPVKVEDVVVETGPLQDKERGILVSYTWEENAKVIGAMTPEDRIRVVTEQIYKIHPELQDPENKDVYIEGGTSQVWLNDPYTLGAFVYYCPHDYNQYFDLFKTPHKTSNGSVIGFAGEAISWATGWVQGALETGLSSAKWAYEHCLEDNKIEE